MCRVEAGGACSLLQATERRDALTVPRRLRAVALLLSCHVVLQTKQPPRPPPARLFPTHGWWGLPLQSASCGGLGGSFAGGGQGGGLLVVTSRLAVGITKELPHQEGCEIVDCPGINQQNLKCDSS